MHFAVDPTDITTIDSYTDMLLALRIAKTNKDTFTIKYLLDLMIDKVYTESNKKDAKEYEYGNIFCQFLQLALNNNLTHDELIHVILNFKYSPMRNIGKILELSEKEVQEILSKTRMTKEFRFQKEAPGGHINVVLDLLQELRYNIIKPPAVR